LDKKKEEKEKNDIVEIKAKKKRLEDDIEALTKSAEEYADKAESKGKVTLITKLFLFYFSVHIYCSNI
jgi:flagellar biosynthesis chaperone FliJ